jgi:hypothetical protein
MRKIQDLPYLRQLSVNDENVRIQLKTLNALAFVDENYVHWYFCLTINVCFKMCNNHRQIMGKLCFLYDLMF